MSTPNPLLPQGSLQGQAKGKSNFRIAVFTILGIHVVLICGFLIFGCKPEPVETEQTTTTIEPTNQPAETFDTFNGTDAAANPFPEEPSFPPYGTETATTDVNSVTGAAPSVAITPDPVSTAQPPVTAETTIPTNLTPSIPTADPIPSVAEPTVPTGEMTTHVVASGDTLSGIAPKYGVTVRAIQDANPDVNPNRLQIGQKLNIPARSATAAPAATSAPSTGASEYTIYTVKSGDFLGRIADQHGTTVRAIKNANGLRTDRINVGQKLKIPAKSNGQ